MRYFLVFVVILVSVATDILINIFDLPTVKTSMQETLDVMVVTLSTVEPTKEEVLEEVITKPTQTPTIYLAPSVTPTPAYKDTFGEPKAIEDFRSDSTGFGLTLGRNEDESIVLTIQDGMLIAEPKMSNRWRTWRLRPPMFTDGVLSAEMRFDTCTGEDEAGLIFDAPNYSEGNGYYFGLNCRGDARLYLDELLMSTANVSSILNNDPGAFQLLEMESKNGKISCKVNGQVVLEALDHAHASGYSGIYTAPLYQNTLKVNYRNFMIFY